MLGEPCSAIDAASASAAESNSLHPSVPASVPVRDIKSLAPDCDGGSPSSLTTVARITSSPRPSLLASSASTECVRPGSPAGWLGTDRRLAQDLPQNRGRDVDLGVRGRIAGCQAHATDRLLHVHAH